MYIYVHCWEYMYLTAARMENTTSGILSMSSIYCEIYEQTFRITYCYEGHYIDITLAVAMQYNLQHNYYRLCALHCSPTQMIHGTRVILVLACYRNWCHYQVSQKETFKKTNIASNYHV